MPMGSPQQEKTKHPQKIWERNCAYCGMSADTIDHVIPKVVLRSLANSGLEITHKMIRNRIVKVPACRECNSLLSDKFFNTFKDKKRHTKISIRRRYKTILAMPHWDKHELDELGYNLRAYIYQCLTVKEIIHSRLLY